ncbi:MAG: RNA polymerase sigma factor [Planctomycetota bacterium]|jgi:RNA polymerase sigma-70 factor (ECF subfamily)
MNTLFTKRQLRKLAKGNAQAIEQWFDAYADSLYTFVFYRVGKDSTLAADIVQDTFLDGLRRIHLFDPDRGSMFTWLTYLSRNLIKSTLRERGRETSYEEIWQDIDSGLLTAFEQIATEPLPDEVIEKEETAQLVQMTLANIPANYKHVLKQYYYQLKPPKEIAVSVGVSEGAIKTMLYRARQAFKAAFLRLEKSFNNPDVAEGGSNE